MEFIVGFFLGASCAIIGMLVGACVIVCSVADNHGAWLRSKNDGW